MAVAHELAHWILDRGEAAFVPPKPWGVTVISGPFGNTRFSISSVR